MSFVGYRRGQNHVERGKAIGLDDQHTVGIDFIEIAHLPAMHELERLEAGFVEGLIGAHDGASSHAKFMIVPEGWRLFPHRIAYPGTPAGACRAQDRPALASR